LAESVDLGVAGPPATGTEPGGAKQAAQGAVARDRRGKDPKGRRRQSQAALSEKLQDAPAGDPRRSQGSRGTRAAAISSAAAGKPDLVLEIKPARRMRALHLVLVVAVPLLVIATVAWRYRQKVKESYPEIVKKGRTEGIQALDEGDFARANQLLSDAKT